MKNTVISIFICLILGLTMSFYLFKQYEPVSASVEKLTFLQIAVYTDMESLNKNINITNIYIVNKKMEFMYM